jgi:hypothetical protein
VGTDEGCHVFFRGKLVDTGCDTRDCRDIFPGSRDNRNDGTRWTGGRQEKGEQENRCENTDNTSEDYEDAIIFRQQRLSPSLPISCKPIYCLWFYF